METKAVNRTNKPIKEWVHKNIGIQNVGGCLGNFNVAIDHAGVIPDDSDGRGISATINFFGTHVLCMKSALINHYAKPAPIMYKYLKMINPNGPNFIYR